MFEYFKSKLASRGISLLQETQSPIGVEKKQYSSNNLLFWYFNFIL